MNITDEVNALREVTDGDQHLSMNLDIIEQKFDEVSRDSEILREAVSKFNGDFDDFPEDEVPPNGR